MSFNKATLLNSATERKILEHDRALKGLKVRQYISTDALEMRKYDKGSKPISGQSGSFNIAAGEVVYGSFGATVAKDGNMGIAFPYWNFYVDVNNDPDYYWFNGAQIHGTGRRLLTYGWKYSSVDFDGKTSGKKGKQQIDYWFRNDDSDPHQYFMEWFWLTSYVVEEWV